MTKLFWFSGEEKERFDLVTVREIAEKYDRSVHTVSKWRTSCAYHEPFPQPVGRMETGLRRRPPYLWNREEVFAWCDAFIGQQTGAKRGRKRKETV